MQNYGNDSNSYQNRASHLDQSFNSAKSALQAKLESIRSKRPASQHMPLYENGITVSSASQPASHSMQSTLPLCVGLTARLQTWSCQINCKICGDHDPWACLAGTQDSQSKQKAEKAFDRDLSKLSKIGQSSGGVGSSKAY